MNESWNERLWAWLTPATMVPGAVDTLYCFQSLLSLAIFCPMEAAPWQVPWAKGRHWKFLPTRAPLDSGWAPENENEDREGRGASLCPAPPGCPLWPASMCKMCLVKSWPWVSASSALCWSDSWLGTLAPHWQEVAGRRGWEGITGYWWRVKAKFLDLCLPPGSSSCEDAVSTGGCGSRQVQS